MEELSEANKKLLKTITESLTEICKTGYPIINEIESKTKVLDLLIYRDFFERFIFCFDNIGTLLNGFNANAFAKDYALALIIRTNMLDFLTIAYLKTYFEEFNPRNNVTPNYKTELGKVYCGHISRIFKRHNSEYCKGYISKESYVKAINALHTDYNFLFNETERFDVLNPTKTLKFKKEIRTEDIVKKFLSHPKNITKNYARAMGYYDVYSKYEHFGIISRRFQRISVNERFRNILDALEIMVDGTSFALYFMKQICNIEELEKEFRHQAGLLKGHLVYRKPNT